ncbi:MAG: DNA internalization-related competence protein ComEC/Rec2 [Oscillospiraceae bacterium]|nr:DNA internalization-related competence protein ComEC/Rec2 [Oscillospiraceae bacterium]
MRKLATAAIAFSVAVFSSYYLVPPKYYLICAAAFAAFSLSAILFKNKIRMRLLLVFLAAVVGVLVSFVAYTNKTLPAHEISGTEQTITARVTGYPEIYEEYSTVSIRLTGDNAPKLGAELYSFEDELSVLKPGDIIEAEVKLKTADERYGEAFIGNNADNIYLQCYLNGELQVTGKSAFSFLYFPKALAKSLKASSAQVFDDDTAPLMTALLTGDTNKLYKDTALYAAMSEAGVLHVVAVSGMNVAFLVGFIMLIIRRKRLAALVALPLIWIFVPFAGATPSVIRAAFMQSTVLLAPFFRRENDGLTSLTAVLAILLLINPAACASVSLQLSFSAMLGMILVTPKLYKPLYLRANSIYGSKKQGLTVPQKALKYTLTGICAAFAATIGALVFTTPIAVFYFGYVSLIGILVNVLIFWAISICFILGYISCVVGAVWLPLGTALGALTSLLARYMIAVVKLASNIPYGVIYTKGNLFGYWLALVYLIFILSYFFRRKKEGFRPAIPICLAVIALCCVILTTDLRSGADTGSLTAVDVGQGQSLIMTYGNSTAVIDCGGKGKNVNAGDKVAGLLLERGIQSVDVLLLTHFDDDHVNGVTRLMSRVNIERLIIPDGSFDKSDRKEILTLAEKQGVRVYIIQQDADIEADELEIKVYTTFSQEEPSLIMLGDFGDFEALISGDAGISEELEFLAAHELPDAELFMAGHHGSKTSSSQELLNALNAEYAVVSCGYNNYGHPTEEALNRFRQAGMEIFRTDKLGDITFYIDGEGVRGFGEER